MGAIARFVIALGAMQPLTGKQRRYLRALAHPLHPVVLVGKEGVSEGVIQASQQALSDHELVKVKLPALEHEERDAMRERLLEGTGAALVETIGRVVILYVKHPKEPKIVLPRG